MKLESDTMTYEGQLSREARITGLVEVHCVGLELHSRTGRGAVRSQLARLRFDRHVFLGWFWNLFLSASERETYQAALTITGADHSALDLKNDYAEVELHLYDHTFRRGAERIAIEYHSMTGRMAAVVMESEERIPHRRPMIRFALFACAIVIVALGFRLLSMEFVSYLFRHF